MSQRFKSVESLRNNELKARLASPKRNHTITKGNTTMKKRLLSLTAISLLTFALRSCGGGKEDKTAEETMSKEGYQLNQTVILSRHNIRSPLSEKGSLLERMTPHSWHEWSSETSELTLKGGVLETQMGQYFRKWLEKEKLFPLNYHPSDNEVRIYANAKQRTIATSNYFSSGLLPSFDADIETHVPFDTMDPTFNPQLTFASPAYGKAAEEQIRSLFQNDVDHLKDNYELLSDVIDFRDSEAYKSKEVLEFKTDDLALTFETGKEPTMSGSLKIGCTVSDALTLQYYEEPDAKKAGFGHDLSFEQWKELSKIKDVYGDVLFSAPLVSYNVAHPLLEEIKGELSDEERKFTFLCGHDSNISSVLSSLEVNDYVLPSSIEGKTPIGSKVVFNSFADEEGNDYYGINLVYQSATQLRDNSMLDLENPPMIVPLSFKGMSANKDGLFRKEDILGRLEKGISKYAEIVSLY